MSLYANLDEGALPPRAPGELHPWDSQDKGVMKVRACVFFLFFLRFLSTCTNKIFAISSFHQNVQLACIEWLKLAVVINLNTPSLVYDLVNSAARHLEKLRSINPIHGLVYEKVLLFFPDSLFFRLSLFLLSIR
jgi:hypothetical protein